MLLVSLALSLPGKAGNAPSRRDKAGDEARQATPPFPLSSPRRPCPPVGSTTPLLRPHLEALANRGASHVHKLPRHKVAGPQLGAYRQQRVGRDTKLRQPPLDGQACRVKVACQRGRHLLAPLGAAAKLQARVAFPPVRLDLRHLLGGEHGRLQGSDRRALLPQTAPVQPARALQQVQRAHLALVDPQHRQWYLLAPVVPFLCHADLDCNEARAPRALAQLLSLVRQRKCGGRQLRGGGGDCGRCSRRGSGAALLQPSGAQGCDRALQQAEAAA